MRSSSLSFLLCLLLWPWVSLNADSKGDAPAVPFGSVPKAVRAGEPSQLPVLKEHAFVHTTNWQGYPTRLWTQESKLRAFSIEGQGSFTSEDVERVYQILQVVSPGSFWMPMGKFPNKDLLALSSGDQLLLFQQSTQGWRVIGLYRPSSRILTALRNKLTPLSKPVEGMLTSTDYAAQPLQQPTWDAAFRLNGLHAHVFSNADGIWFLWEGSSEALQGLVPAGMSVVANYVSLITSTPCQVHTEVKSYRDRRILHALATPSSVDSRVASNHLNKHLDDMVQWLPEQPLTTWQHTSKLLSILPLAHPFTGAIALFCALAILLIVRRSGLDQEIHHLYLRRHRFMLCLILLGAFVFAVYLGIRLSTLWAHGGHLWHVGLSLFLVGAAFVFSLAVFCFHARLITLGIKPFWNVIQLVPVVNVLAFPVLLFWPETPRTTEIAEIPNPQEENGDR